MKDFYYILGTDVNCTSYEIREAYRKLSKKFHPDLNQNDSYFESQFREIREAYETLIDPDKRNQYDAALKRFRSMPPVEENKKQHYFISRSVDIAFTTILVLVTLMFGDYVIKSISSSKAAKVSSSDAGRLVFSTTTHHRKKQNLKLKSASKSNEFVKAVPKPDATVIPLNKPAKVVTDTNVRPIKIVKINADSVKSNNKAPVVTAAYHPDYLYEAYINSNITGLVYMHKLDDYNSAVVKVIPTNSKVFVLEKGDPFYKIKFNNIAGYVPKWTVKAK